MTFNLPDLSRASLNEIIFEGRNQAYGAFDLRRSYDQHLKRAVGLMLGLCLLLIGLPLAWQAWQKDVVVPLAGSHKPQIIEYVIENMPPIEQPPVQQKPVAAPKVNTTEFVTRRVVANEVPVDDPDVVAQALLATANVGTTTVTDGEAGPVPPVVTASAGTGTALEEAPTTQTFEYVEQMPEFEGGAAALLKFLAKNIRYHPLALRNGVEGKIFLKFVVNERGEVENPTILKGLGAGLDEEAARVVKLLHFTPGRQNGRAVKVYYSLPISFQIR